MIVHVVSVSLLITGRINVPIVRFGHRLQIILYQIQTKRIKITITIESFSKNKLVEEFVASSERLVEEFAEP